MRLGEVVYTVCLTVAGSIAIAYTTLWLQERIRRRRLHRSLYHEIVANLSVAKRDREIINVLERKTERKNKGGWTYFDISPLRTFSYQDFRLSGEGLNLPGEIRLRVDEVYELIGEHNRQVSFLTGEFLPRTGGMSKRLESIVEKLNSLEEQLGKGRK